MASDFKIPGIETSLPYQFTPPDLSETIPTAAHRMAANCFVAITGTSFSAVGANDLDTLARYLRSEAAPGNDAPAVGIWNAALDQAQAVLNTDTIAQRVARTTQFTLDAVTSSGLRHLLTAALRPAHDVEPPLRFDARQSPPVPGRCR